jgi:hypothetical protein
MYRKKLEGLIKDNTDKQNDKIKKLQAIQEWFLKQQAQEQAPVKK